MPELTRRDWYALAVAEALLREGADVNEETFADRVFSLTDALLKARGEDA